MPLHSEGPKDSVLSRLGSRLWALAGDWLIGKDIGCPVPPGYPPMIKPTEREKLVVRNHRCDWP